MQIDLTVHIADFINRFEQIVLPGIGRFTKVHQPAKFVDGVHQLSAPSTRLTFEPDVEDSEQKLARYIASQESVNIEQAHELLRIFAQRKQHDIVQDGRASIYPLGDLVHGETGVFYEPADNRLINEYFGLQTATLEPIKYDDATKAATAAQNQTQTFESLITVDKSEGDPLFRWLAIIVLAVLLALCYLKCDTIKDRLGISAAEDHSIGHGDTLLAGSHDSLSSTVVDSNTLASIGSAAIIETRGNGKLLHIDRITDNQIDSVLADDDLRVAGNQEVVECVIILGSYKGQRNAIRMMGLVEQQGHELYVGVNGDFTRVGITYNCAKENLVSYLQNIRSQLSDKAWYLTPQLHVEYAS